MKNGEDEGEWRGREGEREREERRERGLVGRREEEEGEGEMFGREREREGEGERREEREGEKLREMTFRKLLMSFYSQSADRYNDVRSHLDARRRLQCAAGAAAVLLATGRSFFI